MTATKALFFFESGGFGAEPLPNIDVELNNNTIANNDIYGLAAPLLGSLTLRHNILADNGLRDCALNLGQVLNGRHNIISRDTLCNYVPLPGDIVGVSPISIDLMLAPYARSLCLLPWLIMAEAHGVVHYCQVVPQSTQATQRDVATRIGFSNGTREAPDTRATLQPGTSAHLKFSSP